MITIPAGLVDATVSREGEPGRQWLDRLPGLVAAACDRWDCVIDGPATHGGVALVVPVQHPRGPAVLKVSFPHPGNLGEGPALRTFAGDGAVELFEADDTGLELVLERCRPLTLAEHVATMEDYPVEEAIEVAGDLARRLAVPPGPGVAPLADTTQAWTEELLGRVAMFPDALPGWAIDQAVATVQLLAAEETVTMLHGDLHFGNIMWAHREPWLVIDPKGWSGTAAFDAFTVIIGRREILDPGPGFYDAIVRRVYRFAAAALVHPDLALACCQARAASAFYHRLQYPHGTGFDTQFLRSLSLNGDDQHPRQPPRPDIAGEKESPTLPPRLKPRLDVAGEKESPTLPPRLGRERDLALLAAGFETGFYDDARGSRPVAGGLTMTTPETETRPLRMTAPRTALDVLAVLRKVSLSEATLFKTEYRAALLDAAYTFDLAPAEQVLLHWRGVAHHRMFPPTEEEREIHRRLRAGDPLDELPSEPRRRTATHE